MAKREKKKDKRRPEAPVDPYTGEVEPPAEGAYKTVEIVPTETENRKGENYLLEEEDSLDKFILDADSDEAADQMGHYTDDQEISEDFRERQELASAGRQQFEERLNEHHFLSPTISGGDLDAAWDDAVQSGEESVGGSTPTPDQDNVDEIGQAAGLIYEEEEPLNSDKKLLDRDRHRWELNPASEDDDESPDEE